MSEISWGIKVERVQGEAFRRALVELRALDRSRKIVSDEAHVCLPVLSLEEETQDRLRSIANFEQVHTKFAREPPRLTAKDLLGYQPSFEVVGDVAIIDGNDAKRVANALLASCKSLRCVITPTSDVQGEFRTRMFRHVAGEKRTYTIHKEHGLRYRVDLEGAYFTPRMGSERLRISKLVRPGEVVLDMFAGVGPFALLLAKRGAKVTAIEKNPVAVRYLKENALLNKLDGVEILQGDASDLAVRCQGQADRILMNLPHSAKRFLVPAFQAAKDGGTIHYYAISPEDDLYGDLELIDAAAAELCFKIEPLRQGIVRSYAPRRYNVVIDFEVRKNS